MRTMRSGWTMTAAGCLLLVVGCRGTNLGRDPKTASAAPKPDPIYGMRLPPQDIPITGKTETAAEIGDPLYRLPKRTDGAAASSDRAGPAKPAKTGTGDVSALPPRKSEPYRPGTGAAPAALAGGLTDDLRIERRPNSEPARKPTVIPAAAIRPTGFGESFDDYAGRLKGMNAKWSEPIRRGEGYAVLVDVPIAATAPGPVRRYEGQGATPTAALKSALDQVISDRK